MKIKFLLLIFIIFIVFFAVYQNVFATTLDKIVNKAKAFNGASGGVGVNISSYINSDIIPIVGVIGNLIFASVTIILGMKFIWSSAQGKASVLESLPAFVLAVIFFYLAGTLVDWTNSTTSQILQANNWSNVQDRIWGIIYLIVHYGSFAGILFLGLRYMFASAEDKAALKTNFGAFLIGIMFVFCATNVVNYIVLAGKQIF